MKDYFVLVSNNCGEDSCHYLASVADGSYRFGRITDAMVFESQDEVLDFMKKHPNLWYLRIGIANIADVTLEKLKEAWKAIISGEATESQERLWEMHHTLNYVV